jgi:FAD synthase
MFSLLSNISFTPTPQSFFSREQASLSSFKEKHRLLSELDLDTHLIIRFNQVFSQLAAQTFLIGFVTIQNCLFVLCQNENHHQSGNISCLVC